MPPNESQPNPAPGHNPGNSGRPPFKKRNAPSAPPAGAGNSAANGPAQPGAFKPRAPFVPSGQRSASPRPAPAPPPPAKKKRRVRTKQCAKCMMPCILLTRAKLKKTTVWDMVCDFCWPTFCDGNPDYVYGGTWINGRIVDPVQPQGGPDSPKLTPHHIHGPQIVRGRSEVMDDEGDDFDDGHNAAPARPSTPAPRMEAPRPAPVRPAAPARPIPAHLMAAIDALEVEDGSEEDDDTPETAGNNDTTQSQGPNTQSGQNADGSRKKRRRRRKRKGGGGDNGGNPPQAGGAPAPQ